MAASRCCISASTRAQLASVTQIEQRDCGEDPARIVDERLPDRVPTVTPSMASAVRPTNASTTWPRKRIGVTAAGIDHEWRSPELSGPPVGGTAAANMHIKKSIVPNAQRSG